MLDNFGNLRGGQCIRRHNHAGRQRQNAGVLHHCIELMRHKVLDVVGDLYLSGYPIIGTYRGFKTGHFITNNLLRELFKSEDNYLIHQIN